MCLQIFETKYFHVLKTNMILQILGTTDETLQNKTKPKKLKFYQVFLF